MSGSLLHPILSLKEKKGKKERKRTLKFFTYFTDRYLVQIIQPLNIVWIIAKKQSSNCKHENSINS